jgi:hypothetical protein
MQKIIFEFFLKPNRKYYEISSNLCQLLYDLDSGDPSTIF